MDSDASSKTSGTSVTYKGKKTCRTWHVSGQSSDSQPPCELRADAMSAVMIVLHHCLCSLKTSAMSRYGSAFASTN